MPEPAGALKLGDGLWLQLALIPQGQLGVWLCVPPTDLRKSFDDCSALVRTKLQKDPLSGQLFRTLSGTADSNSGDELDQPRATTGRGCRPTAGKEVERKPVAPSAIRLTSGKKRWSG